MHGILCKTKEWAYKISILKKNILTLQQIKMIIPLLLKMISVLWAEMNYGPWHTESAKFAVDRYELHMVHLSGTHPVRESRGRDGRFRIRDIKHEHLL